MFALSLSRSERPIVRNLPLSCLVLWVCWQTLFIWQTSLPGSQHYPTGLLMPWLHVMCLPLFYLAAVTQWTPRVLEELFRWLARGATVLFGYGLLQMANLDQFYRHVEWNLGDPLIGTIGNTSHFGIHLALLLPIVLWQPRWYWKLLAAGMVGMIALTKSAVGFGGALIVVGWWCLRFRQRLIWLPVSLGLLGGVFAWNHPAYRSPEGRLEVWRLNWEDYASPSLERHQSKPTITGFGLGYTLARAQAAPLGSPLKLWKHVHNALLQILMELGVIGLGIVLWGLAAYWTRWWRVRSHPLAWVCGSLFLIFMISSNFHFVDHLWVLASLGLIGYCGVYVLPEGTIV